MMNCMGRLYSLEEINRDVSLEEVSHSVNKRCKFRRSIPDYKQEM
jgi:hypothetical protein